LAPRFWSLGALLLVTLIIVLNAILRKYQSLKRNYEFAILQNSQLLKENDLLRRTSALHSQEDIASMN